MRRRKANIDKKECVACGTCLKACPLGIISIYKGVYADLEMEKCVGCGKCAKVCPASVITVQEVQQEGEV